MKEVWFREETAKPEQGREGARRSDERQLLVAQPKAQSEKDRAQAEKTATELLKKAKAKWAQEPGDLSESPASFEQVTPEEADPGRV